MLEGIRSPLRLKNTRRLMSETLSESLLRIKLLHKIEGLKETLQPFKCLYVKGNFTVALRTFTVVLLLQTLVRIYYTALKLKLLLYKTYRFTES